MAAGWLAFDTDRQRHASDRQRHASDRHAPATASDRQRRGPLGLPAAYGSQRREILPDMAPYKAL